MKVKFKDVFVDCTSDATKIPKENYLESGKYIIIDQGQNQVAGFTNEEKGLYCDVPAIIFGDHTRAIKYVDKPFFLGADGTKLLKAIDKDTNYKYLYYALKNAKIQNLGYNRHFKLLKEVQIEYYDNKKQSIVVNILDKLTDIISKYELQLEKLNTLIKARFVEMFGNVNTNSKGYDIISLNDCTEYMGDIGSNGANKVITEHLDMKDSEDYALLVRFLNFTNNDFKNDVKYISKEAYDFFKKSRIFGGELIICKIGSAGLNYIMPYLNRPVSLGLNQIMVRINDKVNMLYLYNYINTSYGKSLINSCINGAVTKSVTKTALKKIPVVLPPLESQNQFAAFVHHMLEYNICQLSI